MTSLTESVDAALPQLQCTKCGYDGCRPYAEAMAAGHAEINLCPPGGDALIRRLSRLLGCPYKPLDPARGSEKPHHVALIDEGLCIGCTLCIQACPVDAIAGGPKFMHAVIASRCTGCELCLPPCPVDCITMVPDPKNPQWTQGQAHTARQRFERRQSRTHRQRLEQLAASAKSHAPADTVARARIIAAAMQRAREKRGLGAGQSAKGDKENR